MRFLFVSAMLFLTLMLFTTSSLFAAENTSEDIKSVVEGFGLSAWWVGLGTAVVAVANIITAMTKTTWDNKILAFVFRLLNILALNVGKNKNADDKK